MVTAEVAAALPALLAVLLACLWLIGAAAAQIRCGDAAREAARVLARGDGAAAAVAIGRAIAPEGASLSVGGGSGQVVVTVSARHAVPGPLAGVLPALPLESQAVAATEQP